MCEAGGFLSRANVWDPRRLAAWNPRARRDASMATGVSSTLAVCYTGSDLP